MLGWIKISFFSILVIIANFYLFSNIQVLLNEPNFIYSLKLESLYPILYVVLSLYLLCLSFCIMSTLLPKVHLKIITCAVASLVPFIFFPVISTALIVGLVQLMVFLVGIWEIRNHIRSYFHFSPRLMFSSSLHSLLNMLVIFVSCLFFLSYNTYIAKNGFHIPSELTNQVSDYVLSNLGQLGPASTQTQVDTSQLEQLGVSKSDIKKLQQGLSGEDLRKSMKQSLTKQLDTTLDQVTKPYLQYIPALTSVLFYLTLASLAGLGFFLVPMFLSLIFLILEKTHIVKFENQMQEVKRLVIEGQTQSKNPK